MCFHFACCVVFLDLFLTDTWGRSFFFSLLDERENSLVPGEPIRSAYIPDNIPKEFVVSDMPIYPLTRKILSLSGVVPVLAYNPLTSHQAARAGRWRSIRSTVTVVPILP